MIQTGFKYILFQIVASINEFVGYSGLSEDMHINCSDLSEFNSKLWSWNLDTGS